jgi:hypothetical protein
MATTPLAMLQPLDSIYNTLVQEELEANCLDLSKPWSPESPIEELLGNVDNNIHLAHNGHAHISEVTTISIHTMFETS